MVNAIIYLVNAIIYFNCIIAIATTIRDTTTSFHIPTATLVVVVQQQTTTLPSSSASLPWGHNLCSFFFIVLSNYRALPVRPVSSPAAIHQRDSYPPVGRTWEIYHSYPHVRSVQSCVRSPQLLMGMCISALPPTSGMSNHYVHPGSYHHGYWHRNTPINSTSPLTLQPLSCIMQRQARGCLVTIKTIKSNIHSINFLT